MSEPAPMGSSRPYLLRAIYQWIVDNGCTPYLLVDAAVAGVQVPPQAVRDGQVVLNLAPQAIAHLEMGNEEVVFHTRFGGVSQRVVLPIPAVKAVYAQENGQGMAFADEPAAAPGAAAPITPPAAGEVEPGGDDEPTPPPRGTPHLRVIK